MLPAARRATSPNCGPYNELCRPTLNFAISLLTITFPPPPHTAQALPAIVPPHYPIILTLTPLCPGCGLARKPRLRTRSTRLLDPMKLNPRRLQLWFSSSAEAAKGLKRSHDQMNESEDEDTAVATRQKQSEGPLATMILIRVGEAQDSQTIPIHRKFLCKMSRYFKNVFKDDPESSSFDFPEQEPEIFERAMNWIYGEGFLLPKDTAKSDGADWLPTQASQEAQDTNGPASLLVVEHGSGYRQAVSPEPSTKFIDLATGSDFTDDEQEIHAPADASNETEAPTPLDTMMLSKLYALAEFLKMDKLCNELIELLGKRLGYDGANPSSALVYAFERCSAGSPLRELLIDFTARSTPILDPLGQSTFDATPELWRALVKELIVVRGADVLDGNQWAEHFESTLGDYRV